MWVVVMVVGVEVTGREKDGKRMWSVFFFGGEWRLSLGLE